MTDVAVVEVQVENLTVNGTTTLQTLEAEGRPVVPQGISVLPTPTYTISPSLATNSIIIFQPPVVPNTTCFLPLGSSVPVGFYVRVINMDPGATSTVLVCPSGEDVIFAGRSSPAFGSPEQFSSVKPTGNSNWRWMGTFWFRYF